METTLSLQPPPSQPLKHFAREYGLIAALVLILIAGSGWLAYSAVTFKEHYKGYPPGSEMLRPELVAKAKAEKLQSLRLLKNFPGGDYNNLSGQVEGKEYSFKRLPAMPHVVRFFSEGWKDTGFEIDFTGSTPLVTVSEAPKTLKEGLLLQSNMEKAIAASLDEVKAHRLEEEFRKTGRLPPRNDFK